MVPPSESTSSFSRMPHAYKSTGAVVDGVSLATPIATPSLQLSSTLEQQQRQQLGQQQQLQQ